MGVSESAGFPAEELLALVCERVLADPAAAARAGPMLERVREALGLTPEAARALAGSLEAARAGAPPAAEARFSAEEVFETACRRAWADGALQRGEVRMLRALGAALGLKPDRTRAIADRVADPDGAEAEAAGTPMDPIAAVAGGRYRDPVLLGLGGMGAVYRAYDGVLGREVAIKLVRNLPDDPAAGEQIRSRFLREAKTLAQLSHPGLPAVHDVGETPILHIVMELIEGRSLQSLYAAQGPMAPARVKDWLLQAAGVLGHAHARGVVHRDVKPDNLMLESTGRIRVVDFGIALVGDATRMTEAGIGIGTLGFLPPEQVSAVGMGPRSDVYALAATAFFLLTGRHPYTLPQLAVGRGFEPPPLPPDLDPGLAEALRRGLRLDPAERPACMSELIELAQGGGVASRVEGGPRPGFRERYARWRQAHDGWLARAHGLLVPLEAQGGAVDPARVTAFARAEAQTQAAAPPAEVPVHPEDRELAEAEGAARRDLASLEDGAEPQEVFHLWGSVRLARRRLAEWLARREVHLAQAVDGAVPFPCRVRDGGDLAFAEDPDEVRAALEGLLTALGEDLIRAGAAAARVEVGPAPDGRVRIELTGARASPDRPTTGIGKWASVGMLAAWSEARRGRCEAREAEGQLAVGLELPAVLARP